VTPCPSSKRSRAEGCAPAQFRNPSNGSGPATGFRAKRSRHERLQLRSLFVVAVAQIGPGAKAWERDLSTRNARWDSAVMRWVVSRMPDVVPRPELGETATVQSRRVRCLSRDARSSQNGVAKEDAVRTSSLNLVELPTRRGTRQGRDSLSRRFRVRAVPSPALIEASLRVTAEFSLGAARCR
jgi:hypothetical protein